MKTKTQTNINNPSTQITMENKDILFPHEKIRDSQHKLIKDIQKAVESKRSIIAHAPTGLGKTAAALSPALTHAIKNNLKVFFLTSRHTQHKIAIDTLRQIKLKHNADIRIADIIGKKAICPVPGVETLYSNEFTEYCKQQRKENKCEFYTNTKKGTKLTVMGQKVFEELNQTINSSDNVVDASAQERLCSYEITMELAKKANVIIADYYYIFNENISTGFFLKTGTELENSIIIVDEAHNLPSRIRELASERLTTFMLKRAIKEARKHSYTQTIKYLVMVQDALNEISNDMTPGKEKLVKRDNFVKLITADYDEVIADLQFAAEHIRESQKQSFIGGIARFLESWIGTEEGFTRIISTEEFKNQPNTILSYRCLDPSVITRDIVKNSYSTIFMSGTLTPTDMYQDLLGADNAILSEYENPFPYQNRLNLVIPKTTTKFTKRNESQFKAIAGVCAEITNNVPGNSMIFFPSYYIRDYVYAFYNKICNKTLFVEKPGMTKLEKEELLDNFKKYKKTGAVLLAAISGSYGEGIDLPGDLLKSVTVVGLPLSQPDLETKELISYFDKKFNKGWDYGYLFPAFNKTLQNAGRCIRSETDKGLIVFLDERYIWPMYRRCFPTDWEMELGKDYLFQIEEFFENNK